VADGSALCAHLEGDIGILEAVRSALEAEYQALKAGESVELEQATALKARHLHAYTDRQQHLRELLGPETSLAELIEKLPAQRDSNRRLRASLEALAAECQRLNQRNGQVISSLQSRTRDALDILRHNSLGPTLYADDGHRARSGDSRSLGKA